MIQPHTHAYTPIATYTLHICVESLLDFFPTQATTVHEVASLCQTGFPCGSAGKKPACNSGDLGSIPESRRSPGGGHGNQLQHSCLENPKDREDSPMGYSPWIHTESDMTEVTSPSTALGTQDRAVNTSDQNTCSWEACILLK